ncbi:alanine--tRNA ligase-related protein [Vibrio salinus]|uniref:alanine--tRNA ligase-related protein n=1 Tax=Vibrio salinus TaxID=2899784 RepID=UPI001E4E5C6B|nr:alanyl-tRNA editing protein [Vibrio salinus]MCE0492454.1 alanyl-tRNA editing protein [Vibrio salinus]
MTEKIFWSNPYQTHLRSKVVRIEGKQIELSHTIFYAESGGQESDRGTISGIQVMEAKKEATRIIYTLASEPDWSEGDEVETQIDWERRYALMKLHFAAEIVLELFTQRFEKIIKIGAHISEDKSRIDFEWPESIGPVLTDIQVHSQKMIDSDLPIFSGFSDEEKERRYWKIDHFAQVSCGGTHLRKTSEIGKIKLKRKNIGKGKERVEITLMASI